ncbi:hypothetical protein R1flu_024714 [Riccia fluitans]|uniref:CBS domain-containing protein n=1 Tax=Riccia fluitans TaxID=41844 RepID=A0ABD1XVQ6_9MARC
MFGEGTGGGAAPASPPGLVPTRFVWTHGGRRVHLCGSFTRWQDTMPMSPMEGLPSVFQVVCTLPPGYHQYKFIVDGEWRHDDQQSVMSDALGNVNNWILVKEPEPLPGVEGLGQLGASMDVDHDMPPQPSLRLDDHHHQVQHHMQAALLPEVPALSEVDAAASRQRIADFLLRYTAYELLPESGKVVALDVTLPVKQAFHALYEQGLPAAPLWDSDRQQFVGMLSAADFITILKQLGSHGAQLAEEDFDTHTIAAWKEEKLQLATQMDGSRMSPRRSLLYVGPDDSLRQVADRLLEHEVAMVPVLHFPPHNGSVPQLLHLASLSGVLKCLHRHFRNVPGSLPLLSQPIGALPLGTWIPEITGDTNGRQLAVLRPNATLSEALSLLLQTGVSSLPIVDEHGSLVDVYSRSDITALARDRSYAHLQLDVVTVTQALQLGAQDWGNGPGGPTGASNRLHMCVRSETLRSVIERLAHPGVRRLICIEAGSKRVEGIISLRDVFNFLLGL